MNIAQRIALWSDKLRDLSALGLRFAENIYDRDRYEQLQALAMEMAAVATGVEPAELEPLREGLFSHPTPLTCAEAAIIDAAGRILLIQRSDNGRWALPGGALEVGETPAEGAMREALEETGVACRATALVGLYDSRLTGAVTSHHLYIMAFLCQPTDTPQVTPSHEHETLDVRWFSLDEVPSAMSPGHDTRVRDAFAMWSGEQASFFDRPDSA